MTRAVSVRMCLFFRSTSARATGRKARPWRERPQGDEKSRGKLLNIFDGIIRASGSNRPRQVDAEQLAQFT
jgi:hypothetical protein